MLTLVEKPGKPGTDDQGRSRSSDLINYGADNGNFDYEYYEAMAPEPLDLTTRIDRFLIGRSNSSNYSSKWKRDFEQRPTWCDADLSLQAIKRGAATGNRAALYSRSFIQNCLYNLGCFIQHHGLVVLLFVCALFSMCCYGLQYVRIETDIVKLWVSEGGRLDAELHYFQHVQDQYANETWTGEQDKYFLREDPDPLLKQRPQDEGSGQGFQVLIQTANEPDENLLTKEGLTRHVDLLQHLVDLKVDKYGVNWTLSDICFKPGGLDIANDSVAYSMKPMLERLIPCIWITPIDCFYEGSKPVGPHPALDTSSIQSLVGFLGGGIDIPTNANWGNLNPAEIISVIGAVFDLGTVKDFFLRTGIGAGYLDRPCIDPLDPLCPVLAPNYYDACPAMELLQANLTSQGKELSDLLEAEVEEDNFAQDLFAIFMSSEKKKPDNETDDFKATCKKFRKSFLHWFNTHPTEAATLFDDDLMPVYPDYGKVMKGGCRGFASSVLNWPEQMILGGVKPVSDDSITAEALQSVILVSTPTDVYKRLRNDAKIGDIKFENGTETSSNITSWSPEMAAEIVSEWQRLFTQSIYNHELNFRTVSSSDGAEPVKELKRIIHPLASTSISDMLAEFCDFNYRIIFIGYVLMLVYAVYSQMRLDDRYLPKATSCMGLAVAGVLIVTFASISGLGLATWFGIEFNAATTQIVPFLTLGIGVDNVFLLLHNYPQVVANVKHSEIGVLLKETGMSILMTSTNNIFAFLAGTMLPIPALRSFCTQSSILLTFNLIAVLTIYPAIIGLDLRRRKSGRRDIFCCAVTSDSISEVEEDDDDTLQRPTTDSAYGVLRDKPRFSKTDEEDDDDIDDENGSWLHAFLRKYYIPLVRLPLTKAAIIAISVSLFAIGIIGLQYSVQGLELSDVLPDNTAPAAFLKARDKYFSFYPMSIVLRGDKLDFAHKQHLIENLRSEIGQSKFIVKLASNEPSERYWLGLFQEWLIGLQAKLDDAHRDGFFSDGVAVFDENKNKSISNELRIAVSMVCSYGMTYDCNRIQKGVKLIDASGTINEEGFYNYLYAWVEYENMFYTVSQASFYPKLKKLRQGPPNNKYRFFIPPAPQPVYSQIPFYLTGVKDTPGIVAMIKEIRAICDKYAEQGLDNYPSGIAFTFWEQYLDLTQNLMVAIGIIAFAVFCVISLLLFNPWAAACIMIILLMMTVELAGFLGLCQIKLNPVSAVSLITAVGLGVEFTAHVVFAFLTSLGTRDERMVACIDRVFVPVIHGALSTLLGILMLGFSEFEFVVKYFFIIMFALIVIGLVNGLALLPVLLSLIGPSCEIRPTNGTNRLPVPPALPRHRRDRYDTNGFNNRAHRHPLAMNPLGGRDSKSFLPQSPAALTKAFDNVSSSFRRPPAGGHHQLLRTPPSEFVAENNV